MGGGAGNRVQRAYNRCRVLTPLRIGRQMNSVPGWGLNGSFRKLGTPYFGVLIVRILLFRVVPYFRKLLHRQGSSSQLVQLSHSIRLADLGLIFAAVVLAPWICSPKFEQCYLASGLALGSLQGAILCRTHSLDFRISYLISGPR